MKEHTTKLIQGSFTPERAKGLLLELLSKEINLFQLKKFCNEERYGHDTEQLKPAIDQLAGERNALARWLDSVQQTDHLKIDCEIKIQLIKQ